LRVDAERSVRPADRILGVVLQQLPDDKVLRGESHAGRFKKLPDAVKASQPQTIKQ
jgi:hypothetical protein